MRPIVELLNQRGQTLWSVDPQASVFEALQILASHDAGALMVMEQGRLVGILSERDYTRKVALAGKSSRDLRVRDIMTTNVRTVGPRTGTRECMALMSQHRFRHLPVVDGNTVLGMVSISDIMDDIIANHEETIHQLQHYIAS